MQLLIGDTDARWLRTLSVWTFLNGLVLFGVLVTFAILMAASQAGALPPEYDELVWAAQLPALYRLATTLDVAGWLALGGFFVLTANCVRHTPVRSTFIAACGVGQLSGVIGAFTRLTGVSALAAQYGSAASGQHPAILRSFLDLQLSISAHFGVGSLLWSLGLLLVASAAWSGHTFPRWLAGLIAVTGACNLIGDSFGIVGVPVPFELFILPLVLLITSLFAVARICGRQVRAFPVLAGTISPPRQEHAS
jgi:hypothetical protein